MKVICIDASPNRFGDECPLIEGKKYTKIREVKGPETGTIHYIIKEFKNQGFGAFRFIPLSDIDETELVNEFLTEKA